MDIKVFKSNIEGRVKAPPSKSYTHRYILAGALGDRTEIANPLKSADTKATASCSKLLGADINWKEEKILIRGFKGEPDTPDDVLDCRNSGTTLRLFAGASSLVEGFTVLTGDDSLRDRPNGPLLDSLKDLGARAHSTRKNGKAPIITKGPLLGGDTKIDASISSQFVSSLLFVGGVTKKGIKMEVEGLKSRPYVEMTKETLRRCGVYIEDTPTGFKMEGGQTFSQETLNVPGDFSSASYLLAAGALKGSVEVENLRDDSQGDSIIVDVLERMGAKTEWNKKENTVKVSSPEDTLKGIKFDGSDNPDLVPTIAVLGAFAKGKTQIENIGHLRYKEVDRLAAVSEELEKLNVKTKEKEDSLTVYGKKEKDKIESGKEIDSRDDHRIAMAFSLVGLISDIKIKKADSIDISYPNFIKDMENLGAKIKTY